MKRYRIDQLVGLGVLVVALAASTSELQASERVWSERKRIQHGIVVDAHLYVENGRWRLKGVGSKGHCRIRIDTEVSGNKQWTSHRKCGPFPVTANFAISQWQRNGDSVSFLFSGSGSARMALGKARANTTFSVRGTDRVAAQRREQARLLAEQQRRAEQQRLVGQQRVAEQRRIAERQRVAEQQRIAERQRVAEQQRVAERQRVAEQERIERQQRIAEQQRRAEQERLSEQRRHEERQRYEEQQRRAEQRWHEEQERRAEQRWHEERQRHAERQPPLDTQTASTPMRSQRGDTPVEVQFTNRTAWRVGVYWVDYDGREILHSRLERGDTFRQGTFATHPWRFRSGGDIIAEYVATTRPRQSFEIYGEHYTW